MAQKIFVAHAHEDRGLLPAVEHTLRERGIVTAKDTIMDAESEIHEQKNIREMIKNQISSASMVVIIHSENSEGSGWVNYEAGMAAALEKPIIVAGRGIGKSLLFTKSLGDIAKVQFIEIEEIR
jgi:hypothetical protein